MISNIFIHFLIKLMFVLFICFQALESVLLSVVIRSCRWRGLGGAPWGRHAPAGDLSHGGCEYRNQTPVFFVNLLTSIKIKKRGVSHQYGYICLLSQYGLKKQARRVSRGLCQHQATGVFRGR